MRKLLLTATTATLLMLGQAAHASVFDFSYVDDASAGAAVTAYGTIVTDGLVDAVINGVDYSDVLSISGFRNGVAITGLSGDDYAGADNLVTDTGPYLFDNAGLSFMTSDGSEYNVYGTFDTGTLPMAEYSNGANTPVDVTLTAVPEPASMFLVIAGLMGLALTMRRTRQGGGR